MKNIENQIKDLEPWFHNVHLPKGQQTAPHHFLGDFPAFKWNEIKHEIPQNLEGCKVLDVGCNAGFYSIKLAQRGAHVTAIDVDEHYLHQARWVAKQFNLESQINFKKMQVYDLAKMDENYDIIWFMGVFYHLRYPLLALDILSSINSNFMVFQTFSLSAKEEMNVPGDIDFHNREILEKSAWPKMAFIPGALAGDPTNWWVVNHQGIISMLNSCGYKIKSMPHDEVYIAVKDPSFENAQQTWNRSEFLSATGKEWESEVSQKTNHKNLIKTNIEAL